MHPLLPEVQDYLHTLKPGKGFFQVFAGFNATMEDLGITSTNMRLYKSNNMDEMYVSTSNHFFCLKCLHNNLLYCFRLEEYLDSDKGAAPENIPMMYISFPSAKDPTSCTRFPG